MKRQNIAADAGKVLTENDFAISMSTLMLKDFQKALQLINECKVNRMLDLGCGFGGMTKVVADFFSATEVYGADMNSDRLKVAEGRGLRTIRTNFEVDKLPFPSNYFDLVMSFGVIEHLRYYDNLISESYRVINDEGYLLLSWPNLGSYTQRIALLLGYQPNDVVISKEIYAGTIYNSGQRSSEADHIHAATLKAMKQLLEYYDFTIVLVSRGNPRIVGRYSNWTPLITALGRLCPLSLARRLIIVAKKQKGDKQD